VRTANNIPEGYFVTRRNYTDEASAFKTANLHLLREGFVRCAWKQGGAENEINTLRRDPVSEALVAGKGAVARTILIVMNLLRLSQFRLAEIALSDDRFHGDIAAESSAPP
jgi:hypothetical protein